jgi:16S rRNA (guanine(966)-N(2))-methyltransferase RsmD
VADHTDSPILKKQNTPKPRQVRIIGGLWKRTPLPVADIAGLRPTPDRVRETVFNWLEHLQQRRWDNRRCLDLFAGTGALGFEAASRGAADVVMIESHPAALRHLQATCEKLDAQQVMLRRGDALAQLASLPGKFDVIFLDPPYDLHLLPRMLPACHRLLAEGGLVYAESDRPFDVSADDWLAGWQIVRSDKAGQVFFALLSKEESADRGMNDTGPN